MLWSIGNELPSPATPAEARYIAGAAALGQEARSHASGRDPDQQLAGPGVPERVRAASGHRRQRVLRVVRRRRRRDDDRDALGPFLDTVRACYPTKAIFISEFGFDANRDGPVEERGTYAFQANSVAFHLGVFASKPWLSGAMYFLLQDAATWLGYSGGNPRPNPPFDQKGLIDLYGNLKPAFAIVASIYKATTQIAPKSHSRRR